MGLGVAQGGGGAMVLLVMAEEFDHEDHAGLFIDGPEGAEDGAAALGEEGGGKANKFINKFALVADAGFAGGEADEGQVKGFEFEELLEGEGFVVGEVEGGVVRVGGVVSTVAGEVEEGGGSLEVLGEGVGGDVVGGEGLGLGVAWGEKMGDEVGFEAGEADLLVAGGVADQGWGGVGGWGVGCGG